MTGASFLAGFFVTFLVLVVANVAQFSQYTSDSIVAYNANLPRYY